MTVIAAPTATLPTAWAHLHAALDERRPVAVAYHGLLRVVCPHALGWRHGRAMVLGYQVGGQTSTGHLDPDPAKRWRCMYIDEIERVATDVEAAWQTPANYNPQHPFNAIDQLSAAISDDTTTPRSVE